MSVALSNNELMSKYKERPLGREQHDSRGIPPLKGTIVLTVPKQPRNNYLNKRPTGPVSLTWVSIKHFKRKWDYQLLVCQPIRSMDGHTGFRSA